MRKALLVGVAIVAAASAQNPSMFAGLYYAPAFHYTLQVQGGNPSVGASYITLVSGSFKLSDGGTVMPLAVGTSITVDDGALAETVVPIAVRCFTPTVAGTCQVSAVFTRLHAAGSSVRSATFGLQEALNAAAAAGGGRAMIDGKWALMGGTAGMVAAATTTGTTGIVDVRNPIGGGTGKDSAIFYMCAGPCATNDTSGWSWVAPYASTLTGCTVQFDTVLGAWPTGAGQTTFNVYKNGTTNSVFSAGSLVVPGGTTAVVTNTAMHATYGMLAANDKLAVKITDQAGTVTGQRAMVMCSFTN